jgi:hypothetical protein
MKLKLLIGIVAVVALIGVGLKIRDLVDPLHAQTRLAEKLLSAIEHVDYDAFLKHADKKLQSLHREDFESLAAQSAERLKAGHALVYVDSVERKNVQVTRWRVTFNNGSPEALLTVGSREGEIAVFALR